MSNTKTKSRARWRQTAFQNEVAAVVAVLRKGAAVVGNVDLGGIAIGTTGPLKELAEINLYRAKLTDVDASFADLSCSMNEAVFERVRFAHAEFDRCLFGRARLIDCDFAQAKLIVNVDDSVFEQCNFSGASFLGGRNGVEYGGRRAKFIRCNFTNTTFKQVEFRATQFVDCVFDGAKFMQCDLRGVRVEGPEAPRASQFEKMDIPPWAKAHDHVSSNVAGTQPDGMGGATEV